MTPKVLFLTAIGLTLSGILIGFTISTHNPLASAETVHVSATENQANLDASKQKPDNVESVSVPSTPSPTSEPTPSAAPKPKASPSPCST